MNPVDFWYIRFPDGRILRAASTPILRQELTAGHIPLGSTVRRSPSEEWVSLQWTREFSELVEHLAAARPRQPEPRRKKPAEREQPPNANRHPPAEDTTTVGSRLDAARLHLVGVRGHVEELLAALDSTLVGKKMALGLAVGLFLGVLFAVQRAAWFDGEERLRRPGWYLAVAAILLLDVLTGLLTRLTYIELARLRPARWREGLSGLGTVTARVVLTHVLIRGSASGLIVLLRWLPYWLRSGEFASGIALAAGMVLEAVLWSLFFFWWLLPSILVVEEATVWRALRQWYSLLRRHFGRVILYQSMAVGMGLLVTAPFLVLIAPLFFPTFHPPAELQEVAGATRAVLLGLAFAPMLTYWIVANVFIYLNLRYGANARR